MRSLPCLGCSSEIAVKLTLKASTWGIPEICDVESTPRIFFLAENGCKEPKNKRCILYIMVGFSKMDTNDASVFKLPI